MAINTGSDPGVRRISMITAISSTALLIGGLLGAGPSTAAPVDSLTVGASVGVAQAVPFAAKPKPAPLSYTPPKGVRSNNPLCSSRPAIRNHLINTIKSVPGREKIRMASWNIKSRDIQNALVEAHRRGVSVRILIDRGNANKTKPNPGFEWVKRELRKGQNNRRGSMKSYARKCSSSCRYPGGIMHTKFFLFSQAGRANKVVMYGSYNATDLAAHSQWNDMFTTRGKGNIYKEFNGIFEQMVKDKRYKRPYRTYQHGSYTSYFYPYRGQGTNGDPLLRELNSIRCKGATGGTGTNGRTKIRIAQTSMHGQRGNAVAQKLRSLYQNGCDVKIVYAVFGNNVLSTLRRTSRGPVPMRHITQDFDYDGVYDKYLHMKSMSVSGVYNGRSDVNVTWNGTANYTGVALASDEIVMRIFGENIARSYADWVDFLYANPPGYNQRSRMALAAAIANGVDPYSKIEVD